MKFLRKIIENGGWVCFFTAVLSLLLSATIEFAAYIIAALITYFYLLIGMPLKFFIDKRSFSKKKSGLILWIVLVLIVLLFNYVMVLY